MKRIFAIVFSVVFVFAAVVPAFAVSAATETETYTEYYGDGSYTVVTITATPVDRKSTRLNSSHYQQSRMPSSA